MLHVACHSPTLWRGSCRSGSSFWCFSTLILFFLGWEKSRFGFGETKQGQPDIYCNLLNRKPRDTLSLSTVLGPLFTSWTHWISWAAAGSTPPGGQIQAPKVRAEFFVLFLFCFYALAAGIRPPRGSISVRPRRLKSLSPPSPPQWPRPPPSRLARCPLIWPAAGTAKDSLPTPALPHSFLSSILPS